MSEHIDEFLQGLEALTRKHGVGSFGIGGCWLLRDRRGRSTTPISTMRPIAVRLSEAPMSRTTTARNWRWMSEPRQMQSRKHRDEWERRLSTLYKDDWTGRKAERRGDSGDWRLRVQGARRPVGLTAAAEWQRERRERK